MRWAPLGKKNPYLPVPSSIAGGAAALIRTRYIATAGAWALQTPRAGPAGPARGVVFTEVRHSRLPAPATSFNCSSPPRETAAGFCFVAAADTVSGVFRPRR